MMRILLRVAIIAVAAVSIWQFSDGLELAWKTLAAPTEARWFDVLSAFGEGLVGPALALSAIALSVTDRRLLLAAILVLLGVAVYAAPFVAFLIAIMIYGF